jgi:hypothetical protein
MTVLDGATTRSCAAQGAWDSSRHLRTAIRRFSWALLALQFACGPGALNGPTDPSEVSSAEEVSNLSQGATAALEIYPETFGAVADGATDSTAAIQKALDHGAMTAATGTPVNVRFAAGTYLVSCGAKQACLRAVTSTGVRAARLGIIGMGPDRTRILVATPSSGLLEVHGGTTSVAGFSVDYAPLPYVQATIVAVWPSAIRVVPKSGHLNPSALKPYLASTFGSIYSGGSPSLKPGVPNALPVSGLSQVDGNTWDINFGAAVSGIAVGDRFVLPLRTRSVLHFGNGRDVSLSNVVLYAGPGLATAWVRNSGTLTIDGLQVRIKPGTERVLSTNADAIHMVDSSARAVVRNCVIGGMNDDAINTHSSEFRVLSVVSQSVLVLGTKGVTDFQVGHRLQVVNRATRATRGIARIIALQPSSAPGSLQVTLDVSLPTAQTGDAVFDADLANPELLVTNNTFGSFRGLFRIRSAAAVFLGNKVLDPRNVHFLVGCDITNQWQEGPTLPGSYPGLYFKGNQLAAPARLIGVDGANLGSPVLTGDQALLTHPLIFNAKLYRTLYPDLQGKTLDGVRQHWLNVGLAQGRRAAMGFFAEQYLASYADLRAAFGNQGYHDAALHYVTGGAMSEGRVGSYDAGQLIFNAYAYGTYNPDLVTQGWDPSQLGFHWLSYGIDEGRRAHPDFWSRRYLSRYPDLAAAFGATNWRKALWHYSLFGNREGRVGY